MADVFTETKRTGLGGNLMGSCMAVPMGILLFLASFVIIWFNEGRVDISRLAADAVSIDAGSRSAEGEGKLVAARGDLRAAGTVGDEPYLKPGNYLRLQRQVEMYAWDEEQKSESKKELGGGTTTTTTYRYNKKWTTSPESSSNFKHPQGHQNPEMSVQGTTRFAEGAKLGVYDVELPKLQLPSAQSLQLAQNLIPGSNTYHWSGNYLYSRGGGESEPQIGDLRISYTSVPNPLKVTVFAQPRGSELVPWVHKKATLYRAFNEEKEAALQTMHGEYRMMLWIFRGLGFLCMWIGLSMVWSPLLAVLNIIPAAGNLGGCLTGAVSFVIALVLWSAAVVVAMVFHNIVLLLLTAVVVLGGAAWFFKMRSPARV